MRPALTREASRILRRGGTFCIIEHNPLNPVTRLVVSRSPVDVEARLLRAGETCRLLEEQGFRVLKTQYFLFLPERLFERIGGVERALRWMPLGGQYAVFAQAL
jgi:hypothetical protein